VGSFTRLKKGTSGGMYCIVLYTMFSFPNGRHVDCLSLTYVTDKSKQI